MLLGLVTDAYLVSKKTFTSAGQVDGIPTGTSFGSMQDPRIRALKAEGVTERASYLR